MSKPKKTLPKTEPEVLKKPLEPIDNRSKPSATAHSHDKALIKYDPLQRYLTEISRYRLLTREEEKEFGIRVQ